MRISPLSQNLKPSDFIIEGQLGQVGCQVAGTQCPPCTLHKNGSLAPSFLNPGFYSRLFGLFFSGGNWGGCEVTFYHAQSPMFDTQLENESG